MKVYTILTTKNRTQYFQMALNSVFTQIRTTDFLVVVSDSDDEEDQKYESNLLKQHENVCFLINNHTRNYAGSLNTALSFIIGREFIDNSFIADDIYIAILDDDDIWLNNYLKECADIVNKEDFVVCGIKYKKNHTTELLSIPNNLTINDFLKGNPHIQGSNTFVKLTTLLKAGTFDEQLFSTTDRDIFVRIMMLNPSYVIINKYLVEVDARTSHSRITTNREIKLQGLQNFYYKYAGLMDDEIKQHFFSRAKEVFGIETKNFHEQRNGTLLNIQTKPKINTSISAYDGFLTVGVIITEYKLGLRLIKQLVDFKRGKLNILLIANFQNSTHEYELLLKKSFFKYKIITLSKIKYDIQNNLKYRAFDRIDYPDIITDIAVTRTLLNDYLYDFVNAGYIWILDDDMELKEFIIDDRKLITKTIDIDVEIAQYHLSCDAVIGGYSNDAPLPTLAVLRRSLLDYVYHQFSNHQELTDLVLEPDYYYDLSDYSSPTRETPFPIITDNLDLVFSGKAVSRPLFTYNPSNEVKGRGGNTLIFNKELLKIVNISISLLGIIARRGDYFWLQQAREQGYKIKSANFSLVQNRPISLFQPQKEFEKLTKDLIGSSFTKAYSRYQSSDEPEISAGNFAKNFTFYFEQRLIKVIESLYRINGLLIILKQRQVIDKYEEIFSAENILCYIKKLKSYLKSSALKVSFKDLRKTLENTHVFLKIESIQNQLYSLFNCSLLRTLGIGSEGIIFTDEIYVYKYFIKIPSNIELLKNCSSSFLTNPHLYDFTIHHGNDYFIIKYKYEQSKLIRYFDVNQLIDLVLFCQKQQILFTNIKKSNFIQVDSTIKFIDYGEDIIPYSSKEYIKMVERIYQMIKYDLDELDFKQLIEETYMSSKQESILSSGINYFWTLLSQRSKEQIHDHHIISLIRELSPHSVLDYGAGKCKIANQISEKYQTSVFDIDIGLVHKNRTKFITTIKKIDNEPDSSFDLINCNLVLCCVDNHANEYIMENIARLLKHNGHLILSICNPLFNYVEHTEIKKCGSYKNYGEINLFCKQLKNNANRDEYHRPLEFYINLLRKFGFSILKMTETEGVDAAQLLPSSEHLIFTCQLQIKPKRLCNTSLLIKTNPMEYLSIYENIKHIVLQLEQGIIFKDKIVVVDESENIFRSRKYSSDNKQKLIEQLKRAKKNKLIDQIVIPKLNTPSLEQVYKQYFSTISDNSHSLNGQAIFASLAGFESVKTSCVLQTDSDMLYFCSDPSELQKQLSLFENENRLATSFSIANKKSADAEFGHRIEVRSCLINLPILKQLLPLNNQIINKQYELAWHRALDAKLHNKQHTKRLISEKLYYIHPENHIKKDINFLATVRQQLDNQFCIEKQYNKVNLQGERLYWSPKSNHSVIIFIRGYNTPPTKLKRLFDSLLTQTYQDYQIIYIDDNSISECKDYVWYRLKYGHEFKNLPIVILNEINKGELFNLDFAMKHVAINPDAIVICIDNDDYLINTQAIKIILDKFSAGADVTVGNCFRKDKPLKKYKVASFDKLYERNGDNTWLHPKCFKRKLFLEIDQNDLKIDGDYMNVNQDFAIMLPIIEKSQKNVFIEDVLYYFEPSENNLRSTDNYEKKYKQNIKNILLDRARNRHEKNCFDHRE